MVESNRYILKDWALKKAIYPLPHDIFIKYLWIQRKTFESYVYDRVRTIPKHTLDQIVDWLNKWIPYWNFTVGIFTGSRLRKEDLIFNK